MTAYSVGSLYHPGRTSWPEGPHYNYRSGAHELLLFYARPSKAEIDDIRKGPCEFAVVERGSAVALCYRFGGQPWSDAPYSWHLVPEGQRDLPSADLEADKRAVLSVLLVDASTGILRAIRQVTWSPEFTRAMHAAIRRQAEAPWSEMTYHRDVEALYSICPTSQALVSLATERTKGGA